MNRFILFLHVLGAIGMGFYLLLPFFMQKKYLQKKPILEILYWMNFITQWILLIQLFTGGFMYFKGNYPLLWAVLVAITYLAIGAFGGMFGYYARKYPDSSDTASRTWLAKIRLHAILTAISMFIIIILMMYPYGF
ncbi:MAG: hypothetical protein WB502_16360 [Thermoactinomyces sp.]